VSEVTDARPDGISALISALTTQRPEGYDEAYGSMVEGLREFLDALAGAGLEIEDADTLRELFAEWTPRLKELEVDELRRPWGHLVGRKGHGQILVPDLYDVELEGQERRAKVVLGRFYVGENMAAHGGAVMVLFDDFLGGMLYHLGLPPSRTAYLKTDFKAITPVGEELQVIGRVDRIEGRKRFVTGELRHGDTVCAVVEGLWVELLPGQG
jgi:acyl-coenzyme A thioesterase PaaI-like protein